MSFSDNLLFSGYNKVAKIFMLADNKMKDEINSSFRSRFKKNNPAITAPDCPKTANHLK